MADYSSDKKEEAKKGRVRDFFKKKPRGAHKTFYDVLGVDPHAKHDEIRLRYLELAKLHHPDGGGDPQQFAEISSAWKVLGNKEQRATYDGRLQYNPEDAWNTAAYNDDVDMTVRVIMSSGFLKIGPTPFPLPKKVLIPLVWLGVEQIEGDTPVYRRFNKLGLMWTIFLLLALRQIYVTIRDWRSYDTDDRPWMGLKREERSKVAWRVLGLTIALSTLPLWYRRWDLLSKGVKESEGGERMADMVARIAPTLIFWTVTWTYLFGPIVGSGTEFLYSSFNRRDIEWNQPFFDVFEYNGSRVLQGLGAGSAAFLCVQRARAKGIPMKFCGKAAAMGLITGRIFGWLLSFAVISNSRRFALKKQVTEPLPDTAGEAAPAPAQDQLAQLQKEVEQLRQAILQKQAANEKAELKQAAQVTDSEK